VRDGIQRDMVGEEERQREGETWKKEENKEVSVCVGGQI